ncbi:hypothetical protein [Brevundimonas variabilis]|uniref:Uncharacterized protein n=1 Tax=Brevundimonas variabilis TaxID=74312 RepID=A0A7W9FG27_9CAUL|nr:hypothetical protein [Brevundimonas variabilis]MBB5746158.1 hypothetical protein [Brevundimonas variabilis]
MSDIAVRARTLGLADRSASPPPNRWWVASFAGCVTLHVAILSILALRLFEPERAYPPVPPNVPIFIEIEPRPLLEGERARLPATAPATSTTAAPETRLLTRPTVIVRAPAVTPRDEEDDDALPSPPAPRLSPGPSGPAATGAPAPADSGAWQVRPEALGARVGRTLRLGAGGCRTMYGRLNSTEQAICDENFNAAAGAAGPVGPRTLNPGEARREARFAQEGAAALARYEARRAPLRSGVGVSGASPDCPGGNLRGTCAGAHLPDHYQNPDQVPYRRVGPL